MLAVTSLLIPGGARMSEERLGDSAGRTPDLHPFLWTSASFTCSVSLKIFFV